MTFSSFNLSATQSDSYWVRISNYSEASQNHWAGVINAATSDITNAMSESVDSHIQGIKKRAGGFRSRTRYREAILFHLGGLDLYPDIPSSIHSKA